MREETIEDQNQLIELIEEAGWEVSGVEMSEHKFTGRNNQKSTRAIIEIVVSKEYQDGFESPYRIK